jgi:hypothetical protein
MATETIYVFLLDEGMDCWRPMEATAEGENFSEHAAVIPI